MPVVYGVGVLVVLGGFVWLVLRGPGKLQCSDSARHDTPK